MHYSDIPIEFYLKAVSSDDFIYTQWVDNAEVTVCYLCDLEDGGKLFSYTIDQYSDEGHECLEVGEITLYSISSH